MTGLQKKIESLSKSQQAEVLKFIEKLTATEKSSPENAFDKHILADANAGKLDNLAAEAISEFKKGNFREI